jgi:hypothetical protein
MKNKPYQIFTARFIGVHAAAGIALVRFLQTSAAKTR